MIEILLHSSTLCTSVPQDEVLPSVFLDVPVEALGVVVVAAARRRRLGGGGATPPAAYSLGLWSCGGAGLSGCCAAESCGCESVPGLGMDGGRVRRDEACGPKGWRPKSCLGTY